MGSFGRRGGGRGRGGGGGGAPQIVFVPQQTAPAFVSQQTAPALPPPPPPPPPWRSASGALDETTKAFQDLYGRPPRPGEADPYTSQLTGGTLDPAGVRSKLAGTIKVPFAQAQDIVSGYWRDLFAGSAPPGAPEQAGLREQIALGQRQPADILGQLQPLAQEQVLSPLFGPTRANLSAATGSAPPFMLAQSAAQQAAQQRPAIGSLDAIVQRAQSLLGIQGGGGAAQVTPGATAPQQQSGALPGARPSGGVGVRTPSGVFSPFFEDTSGLGGGGAAV